MLPTLPFVVMLILSDISPSIDKPPLWLTLATAAWAVPLFVLCFRHAPRLLIAILSLWGALFCVFVIVAARWSQNEGLRYLTGVSWLGLVVYLCTSAYLFLLVKKEKRLGQSNKV